MTKRILLVDDELDFFALLEYRLRDSDYQILLATNCSEALNQVRRHLPDVILVDLLLPDLDGLTLCEILQQEPSARGTPVIMITAVSTEVTRESAKLAGACAYFPKPLDFDTFKAKLQTVLAETVSHGGIDDSPA